LGRQKQNSAILCNQSIAEASEERFLEHL